MKPTSGYEPLLQAQGCACFYCGTAISLGTSTRDHVLPRSAPRKLRQRFRIHVWKHNIVLACARCNGAKGARLPTDDEVARASALWKLIDGTRP